MVDDSPKTLYIINGDSIYDVNKYRLLNNKMVSVKLPSEFGELGGRMKFKLGEDAFFNVTLAKEAYKAHIKKMIAEFDQEVEDFKTKIKESKKQLLSIKAQTLQEY